MLKQKIRCNSYLVVILTHSASDMWGLIAGKKILTKEKASNFQRKEQKREKGRKYPKNFVPNR